MKGLESMLKLSGWTKQEPRKKVPIQNLKKKISKATKEQ